MDQLINVSKLHNELLLVGLPVVSVHSDGTVDYSRNLSGAEKLTAEAVISAHDPVVVSPPSTNQIVHALWKKVMLGDSTDADKILKILE